MDNGSSQTLFLHCTETDVFTYLSRAPEEWHLGTVESPLITYSPSPLLGSWSQAAVTTLPQTVPILLWLPEGWGGEDCGFAQTAGVTLSPGPRLQ